jgi:hypothetical protein
VRAERRETEAGAVVSDTLQTGFAWSMSDSSEAFGWDWSFLAAWTPSFARKLKF